MQCPKIYPENAGNDIFVDLGLQNFVGEHVPGPPRKCVPLAHSITTLQQSNFGLNVSLQGMVSSSLSESRLQFFALWSYHLSVISIL